MNPCGSIFFKKTGVNSRPKNGKKSGSNKFEHVKLVTGTSSNRIELAHPIFFSIQFGLSRLNLFFFGKIGSSRLNPGFFSYNSGRAGSFFF